MRLNKCLLFLLAIGFSLNAQAAFFDEAGYQLPQFTQKIVPQFLEKKSVVKQVLPKYVDTVNKEQNNLKIFVKKVRIQGNTVLTRSELLPLIRQYVGSTFTSRQLHQLALEISQLYVRNGYINSSVVLPNQKIENDTVIFLAIEGKLGEINVVGNKQFKPAFFADIFDKNKPLNIHHIKDKILSLKSHPSIQTIHAEIQPGVQAGIANLEVVIVEKKAYQLTTGIDNYRSPGVGAERLFLAAEHRNITGHQDLISGQIGITQGLKDFSFRYMLPVKLIHSTLSTYYINSDAQLIEDNPDIKITSESSLLGFNWMFDQRWNGRNTSTYLAGYETSSNKTKLIGFPSGCGSAESCESSVFIFSADWQRKTQSNQYKTNVTVRKGISGTEPISSNVTGDPKSSSFLTQWQLSHALSRSLGVFRLSSKLQYAMDSLIGKEKFSLGGVSTVRGYRENTLLRDNGFLLSSEWIQKTRYPGTFVTAFVDYGVGWNKIKETNKESLLSMGGGIAWQRTKLINTELFIGVPLLQRPEDLKNLQDFGIHFSFRYHII